MTWLTAQAICEAVARANMRFVPTKTPSGKETRPSFWTRLRTPRRPWLFSGGRSLTSMPFALRLLAGFDPQWLDLIEEWLDFDFWV
jgi:hypothetical protein